MEVNHAVVFDGVFKALGKAYKGYHVGSTERDGYHHQMGHFVKQNEDLIKNDPTAALMFFGLPSGSIVFSAIRYEGKLYPAPEEVFGERHAKAIKAFRELPVSVFLSEAPKYDNFGEKQAPVPGVIH